MRFFLLLLSCLAFCRAIAQDTPKVVWEARSVGGWGQVVASGKQTGPSESRVYAHGAPWHAAFPLDGVLQGWLTGSNKAYQVFYGDELGVIDPRYSRIALSPDGQILAYFRYTSSRSSLQVFDTATQALLVDLPDFGGSTLEFSFDSRFLAVADYNTSSWSGVAVFDLWRMRWSWFRTSHQVRSLSFVPNSYDLIAAGTRLTRHDVFGNAIWSRSLPSPVDQVKVLANETIATYRDRASFVETWDLEYYGNPLGRIELGDTTERLSFTFAPNGIHAAFEVSTLPQPTIVKDLITEEEILRFRPVTGNETRLAFSIDSTLLFSLGIYIHDSQFRAYDASTGQLMATYGGPPTLSDNEIVPLDGEQVFTLYSDEPYYREQDYWPCLWGPDARVARNYGMYDSGRRVALSGLFSVIWDDYFNEPEITVCRGIFSSVYRTFKFDKGTDFRNVELSPNGRWMTVYFEGSEYGQVYDTSTGEQVTYGSLGIFSRDCRYVVQSFYSGTYNLSVARTSDWEEVARVNISTLLPGHSLISYKPSSDGSKALLYTSRAGSYQLVCINPFSQSVLWQHTVARIENLRDYVFTIDSLKVITAGLELNVLSASDGSVIANYPIPSAKVEVAENGVDFAYTTVEQIYETYPGQEVPFGKLVLARVP